MSTMLIQWLLLEFILLSLNLNQVHCPIKLGSSLSLLATLLVSPLQLFISSFPTLFRGSFICNFQCDMQFCFQSLNLFNSLWHLFQFPLLCLSLLLFLWLSPTVLSFLILFCLSLLPPFFSLRDDHLWVGDRSTSVTPQNEEIGRSSQGLAESQGSKELQNLGQCKCQ